MENTSYTTHASDVQHASRATRLQGLVDSILSSVPGHADACHRELHLLDLDRVDAVFGGVTDEQGSIRLYHTRHTVRHEHGPDWSEIESLILGIVARTVAAGRVLYTVAHGVVEKVCAHVARYASELRTPTPTVSLPRHEIQQRFSEANARQAALIHRHNVHFVSIVHLVTPSRVRIHLHTRRPRHAGVSHVSATVPPESVTGVSVVVPTVYPGVAAQQGDRGVHGYPSPWLIAVKRVAAQLSGKELTRL